MKPGLPWSVKGIESDAREAAKEAARRSGMTLGEWLNSTILEQVDTPQAKTTVRPVAPRARGNEAPAFERAANRLEDIAEKLSRLSIGSPASRAMNARPSKPLPPSTSAWPPSAARSARPSARRCASKNSPASRIWKRRCVASSTIWNNRSAATATR
jgi:hypothetical protein